VSVQDRLPEKDAQYNACYLMNNEKWNVFTSGYSSSFKRFDFGSSNITHWQPLPAPPCQSSQPQPNAISVIEGTIDRVADYISEATIEDMAFNHGLKIALDELQRTLTKLKKQP
jgi:hypothetical protein